MRQYQIDTMDNKHYPMGITILEQGIHVSVAVAADSCSLVLFEAGDAEPCGSIAFPEMLRQGDVWNMTVIGGDLCELEYGFMADGAWLPDPYGRAFRGREIWGASGRLRSPIACPEFDWEGDQPLHIPYEASVIYRIHTRGFTKHHSSQVADKGTFRAVLEKIPYMKELGITTVEMMPVTEFEERPLLFPGAMNPANAMKPISAMNPAPPTFFGEPQEGKLNYWGYAPAYQFAPKAAYSAGQDPAAEFKELVKGLHRAGLELVVEIYFTGQENPWLALDVVRFWVREYHVDGIHLVGEAPVQLLAQDPFLARTKLWAVGWDRVPGSGPRYLGEYNDGFMVDMRQALKGDEGQMNALIGRARRNPAGCGVINYIANTNGFTLMDLVSYDRKHNEANGENNLDGSDDNYSWNCGTEGPARKKKVMELRGKQVRNALVLVFLSQGTPLLLSGDEFGNSQSGNNNAYCQDNRIAWLNWKQQETNRELWEFVRSLIAFRRCHPVFSGSCEPRNTDYLVCGYPDVSYHGVKTWVPEFEKFRRQLGILYCGEYGKKADGSPDDYFYVMYNMHWEAHEYALPRLPKGKLWHVAINTDASEANGFYPAGSEPPVEDRQWQMVPPRSILVLIGR